MKRMIGFGVGTMSTMPVVRLQLALLATRNKSTLVAHNSITKYYQECGNSITQSPKSRCPRSWITIGSHRWGCIQRFSCHTHRHDSLILRNQPIHIFDRDQVTLDKVILEAESGTHMKEDLFFMILRSSGATTDVGSIWLTMVDRVPHCDKLLTWRRRPVGNGY